VRERLGLGFGRLPAPIRAGAAALAGLGLILAIFFGVLSPLVDSSGPTSAVVDGVISAQGRVGRPLTLQLEVTDTGDQTIHPLCVRATFSRPVELASVTFTGIETIPARGGQVCGGMLATQESVEINVNLVPEAAGSIDVTIVPAQGRQAIGPGLAGTLQVAPA
jgi:hypothetical protein